jgi:hypothetical protein
MIVAVTARRVAGTTWLDLDCLDGGLRDKVRAAIERAVHDRSVQCLLLVTADGRWPPTATSGRLVVVRGGAPQEQPSGEASEEIYGVDDLDRIGDVVGGPHVLLLDRDTAYFSVLARLRERWAAEAREW